MRCPRTIELDSDELLEEGMADSSQFVAARARVEMLAVIRFGRECEFECTAMSVDRPEVFNPSSSRRTICGMRRVGRLEGGGREVQKSTKERRSGR